MTLDQSFLAGALVLAACGGATAQPSSTPRLTVDLAATQSAMTAGLPSGRAANLRAVADLAGGDSASAELLDERKFGRQGGIAATAYTRRFDADWFGTATLALGHGGPNWANRRVDLQLSRKWLAQQQLVTSLAAYHASFDNDRSDHGVRVSAAWYAQPGVVLEAGVILNTSQPGSVRSNMPFVSTTFGSAGEQYLSLRASDGREAYQALGSGAQLVDFSSRSLGLTWRRWLAPDWGFTAQVEVYRNPTYSRRTLGAGIFVSW